MSPRETPASSKRPVSVTWNGATRSGVDWDVHCGDAKLVMSSLPPAAYHCIVTSPPYYWQRDYQAEGQIGLEETVAGYVNAIAGTFDEAKKLLRKDGLLFLNLGDTYYSKKGEPKGGDRKNWARRFGLRAVDASGLGLPRKTAIGIPWRVALEMVSRGWTLRSPIIWKREKAQPEPTAKDRPWKTYEMMFMFSKAPVYYFNRKALEHEEDVWTVPAHSRDTKQTLSAYFPEPLVRRCLEIGCPAEGYVLDPFAGSGTVLRAALSSYRPSTGIDINKKSCEHMVNELEKL